MGKRGPACSSSDPFQPCSPSGAPSEAAPRPLTQQQPFPGLSLRLGMFGTGGRGNSCFYSVTTGMFFLLLFIKFCWNLILTSSKQPLALTVIDGFQRVHKCCPSSALHFLSLLSLSLHLSSLPLLSPLFWAIQKLITLLLCGLICFLFLLCFGVGRHQGFVKEQ